MDQFTADIIKNAIEGIFAALFVGLLLYVLRHQDKMDTRNELREKKLTDLLEKFGDCYKVLSIDSNKTAHAVADDVSDAITGIDTLHSKVSAVEIKVDGIDRKVDKIGDKLDTFAHKTN